MKVRWSDDTVTDEPVSWDDFDAQLLSKPGAFDVKRVVTVSSKLLSATAGTATNTHAADESLVTYDVVAHITVVEQQTETAIRDPEPVMATSKVDPMADKDRIVAKAKAVVMARIRIRTAIPRMMPMTRCWLSKSVISNWPIPVRR